MTFNFAEESIFISFILRYAMQNKILHNNIERAKEKLAKKSGQKLNRQESKEKWKRPNQTKNLEGLKIGGRVVLERTS